MVTSGQACCLVLDMEMTPKNRQIAKALVGESLFGVTYISLPTEPITIAKSLISKNPFKYKPYADTPPGSPKIKAIDLTELDKNTKKLPIKSPGVKDTIHPATEPSKPLYSRRDMIAIAKAVFSLLPDNNIEFYSNKFITTKDMYKIMERLMPKLKESISQRTFAVFLTKYSHHFGSTQQSKGKIGRHLYVLKDEYINCLIAEFNQEQK